jgi:hypothetical protein
MLCDRKGFPERRIVVAASHPGVPQLSLFVSEQQGGARQLEVLSIGQFSNPTPVQQFWRCIDDVANPQREKLIASGAGEAGGPAIHYPCEGPDGTD